MILESFNEHTNLCQRPRAEADTPLAPVLCVVVIAATIAIALTWMLDVARLADHLALTGLLAASPAATRRRR